MKKNRNKFLIFILLSVMTACSGNGASYYSFRNIPSSGWGQEDTLFFDPEIEDSLSSYTLTLTVRNNNDYPYRNIWFFIGIQNSDGTFLTDTVNYTLADEFGKWYGAGWGSLYQTEFPYRKEIRFSRSGNQKIAVVQGMRDNPLTGIKDIGLKIIKE